MHTHETNSGMGAVSPNPPFLCTSARSDTTDTTDTKDTKDTNLFGSPLGSVLVRLPPTDLAKSLFRVIYRSMFFLYNF